MTPLAAVVLAHTEPAQVARLVAALDDVPVFLHCDARTPAPVFTEMTAALPARVTVLDRVPTSLASWSLVAAELAGLRSALARTDAEHVAVLSGADYPLLPTDRIVAELTAWAGESWLWNAPMPFARWDTPRRRDGGMWRLRQRFLMRGDQVVYVRGFPLCWPVPRALPEGVEFRASTQWKVYSRRHAQLLLDVVDARPDLVRFWRTTLVPEETFAASVLASPALVGDAAIPPYGAHPWHVQWPEEVAHHPEWLTGADFDRLAAASRAPSVTPTTAAATSPDEPGPTRALFARKFSARVDAAVLDRIDRELRS